MVSEIGLVYPKEATVTSPATRGRGAPSERAFGSYVTCKSASSVAAIPGAGANRTPRTITPASRTPGCNPRSGTEPSGRSRTSPARARKLGGRCLEIERQFGDRRGQPVDDELVAPRVELARHGR